MFFIILILVEGIYNAFRSRTIAGHIRIVGHPTMGMSLTLVSNKLIIECSCHQYIVRSYFDPILLSFDFASFHIEPPHVRSDLSGVLKVFLHLSKVYRLLADINFNLRRCNFLGDLHISLFNANFIHFSLSFAHLPHVVSLGLVLVCTHDFFLHLRSDYLRQIPVYLLVLREKPVHFSSYSQQSTSIVVLPTQIFEFTVFVELDLVLYDVFGCIRVLERYRVYSFQVVVVLPM